MRAVYIQVSKPMYDKIIAEKKRLMQKEKNKVKSRRRSITMVMASNNLARKL